MINKLFFSVKPEGSKVSVKPKLKLKSCQTYWLKPHKTHTVSLCVVTVASWQKWSSFDDISGNQCDLSKLELYADLFTQDGLALMDNKSYRVKFRYIQQIHTQTNRIRKATV